jgi:putative nucleotidyltransferase with HDIG domain
MRLNEVSECDDLAKIIEMYEHVFDLSRDELKNAYSTIRAHEAVEDLSRDELLQVKDEIDQIRHRDEVRSAFFSNVSHEIRTPLTLLLAPLESMLQGELGQFAEEQRTYLKLMYENSRRLLRMVNDLLDFSKIESGKARIWWREDDLADLVRELLETYLPIIERYDLTMTVQIPEKPVPVFMDSEKIEKIINNLVFNAFKYVKQGGHIRIRVLDTPEHVVFSVFNTGDLLPDDVLATIFDRYAQFEQYSEKRSIQGSGLGLALVREFVSLHQGRVRIQNLRRYGIVCSFSLKKGTSHLSKEELEMGWGEFERRGQKSERPIPQKGVSSLFSEIDDFYSLEQGELAEFESRIKKSAPSGMYGSESRRTVMVVEDNPEMRGFLKYILSGYFDIIDAVDGEDGIHKAKAFSPNLIISDVMMPRMNGHQMTRALKADEDTCRIPVILLTARANNLNAMVEGLNIGADDYISKPFNIKELIARANALLRMGTLNSQLENTESVIFSLANAVEAKDAHTEGHCFRLAELSAEIARRAGLPETDIRRIKNGAILHDVGKIGIPECILGKPGHLTDEERDVIRQHPVIGERICRPLRSTSSIISIVRSHHERWDGEGYPDKLAGEAIPIEARIVAIADSFDAMVFDRVYRPALGLERARKVFQDERDRGQWDPGLVDIFLSIHKSWLRGNML